MLSHIPTQASFFNGPASDASPLPARRAASHSSFHRTVFTTSRTMEFFTEKELSMQLGVGRSQWPIAILKELIDNALDACESLTVASPTITVTITPDTVTVADTGPGLPYAILERSLDYLVRVSDKDYYVSPTRGQLGNALKAVWAAPVVVQGHYGRVDVQTPAYACQVVVHLDRIAQDPKVTVEHQSASSVKTGTAITLHWPGIASDIARAAQWGFYNIPTLLERFACFNPHVTFVACEPESQPWVWEATSPTLKKWCSNWPTSPHWYTPERFRGLLRACLSIDRTAGRVRRVRELVADFDGLTGTGAQKAITETLRLARATLEDLVDPTGEEMCIATSGALLAAMQDRARPVQPAALGLVGEAHLRERLMYSYGALDETITYKKIVGVEAGVPYVLECACGWGEDEREAVPVVGINWTPALRAPFPSWPSVLSACRVDTADPVALVVHLAIPRVDVTDRAKSAVVLSSALTDVLAGAVDVVTKRWQKLKQTADKQNRVSAKAMEDEARRQRQAVISIKDASWEVMAEAYLKASDNGRLPANARQIMYAARPMVIALRSPNDIWKNDSQFTQGYLPDFIAEHPDLTKEWDVVYDDRGHFTEPHTEETFGLGTLKVRRYRRTWDTPDFSTPLGHNFMLDQVETFGPACRYKYVLFLEKEGFDELLAAGQIAEKYDLAIMSTKGQTVTAARDLIEALSRQGVTFLVAHDFDKAGIEILDKFSSNTRRYAYTTATRVIDLGLRLADVEALGLAREPVSYGADKDPRVNLERCGATAEEIAFLVGRQDWRTDEWSGARVELNAMTSPQFLAWLEAKFAAIGVEKVVPNNETLAVAYRHLARNALLQRGIDDLVASLPDASTFLVPDDLAETVQRTIAGTPQSWDAALWRLACDATRDDA